MKFSPDADKNPYDPHIQINQTTDVHKLIMSNNESQGKGIERAYNN